MVLTVSTGFSFGGVEKGGRGKETTS